MPEQPSTMKDVLKLCMQNQSENQNPPEQMTKESRDWLNKILDEMQNDTPQHRLNAYATYCLESSASIEDRAAILDGIIDICEDIDMANDFGSMGLYKILLPLLNIDSDLLKGKCASLITTLCQNNENAQLAALETPNLIDTLCKLTEEKCEGRLAVRCLSALSAIGRSCLQAQKKLIKDYSIFTILLNAIQSIDTNLQIKAAFTLSSLVVDIPTDFSDNILELTKQLIYVYKECEPLPTRDEYISLTLLNLSLHHPRAKLVLVDSGHQWLQHRLKSTPKDAAFKEEIQHLKKILKICQEGNNKVVR